MRAKVLKQVVNSDCGRQVRLQYLCNHLRCADCPPSLMTATFQIATFCQKEHAVVINVAGQSRNIEQRNCESDSPNTVNRPHTCLTSAYKLLELEPVKCSSPSRIPLLGNRRSWSSNRNGEGIEIAQTYKQFKRCILQFIVQGGTAVQGGLKKIEQNHALSSFRFSMSYTVTVTT